MAFGKKKNTVNQKEINLQIQNHKLHQEIQKTNTMNRMVKNLESKMSSHQSFPPDFYPTGIKQGVYSGLNSNSNRMAREKSRKAVNISPVAGTTVNTISTLSVGTGLQLEASPAWILLDQVKNWDLEKKSDWMKKSEARYKMWCKRPSSVYDQSMNRYQQEQQEFKDLLIDGEYFHIYRYSSNSKLNPMTIQIIRPEDVRNPQGSQVAQGNFEEDGIEYNSKGQAVAYHIYNYSTSKTVRIIKKGSRSGRVFVNHVKLGKNRRGVGIIANMISELMKLGDYEMLEIQAAIVNALYAVWVETPEGDTGVPVLTSGIGGDAQANPSEITQGQWKENSTILDNDTGGKIVEMLPGGFKPHSFDTKRPNTNFGVFSDQVKKNLFGSINMPLSVMDKQFQNNYSASRGELILAWYEIEK